jgi:hypothetical protein
MKRSGAKPEGEASQLISERIADLGGWRGETLGRIRALIQDADPDVLEEWKWRGTPVWSHDGILCTGEVYKNAVKMTFAKGAFLEDPSRLFNSSLEGNLRRAIDVHEGEEIDATALKALIRAAVALNVSGKKAPATKTSAAKPSASKAGAAKASASKAGAAKASASKASTGKASASKAAGGKAAPPKRKGR